MGHFSFPAVIKYLGPTKAQKPLCAQTSSTYLQNLLEKYVRVRLDVSNSGTKSKQGGT